MPVPLQRSGAALPPLAYTPRGAPSDMPARRALGRRLPLLLRGPQAAAQGAHKALLQGRHEVVRGAPHL